MWRLLLGAALLLPMGRIPSYEPCGSIANRPGARRRAGSRSEPASSLLLHQQHCKPEDHRKNSDEPSSSTDQQRISAVIRKLLEKTDTYTDGLVWSCSAMEKETTGAYCNQLFRVALLASAEEHTYSFIVKIFSPLAQKRMISVRDCLRFHAAAGAHGLGPEVVATVLDEKEEGEPLSSDSGIAAILMKEFSGRTLAEEDLHGSDYLKSDSTRELLQKTAVAVARLHQLGTTTNRQQQQGLHSNSHTSEHNIVMFHACEVMLSLCDRHWSVSGAASFDRLRQAYDTQKQRLQQMLTDENNLVETGHGDLKPSNIMVIQQQSPTTHTHSYEIRLIDWDLAGRHFRAFDLAKLFRTERPTAHTVPNRRFFLEAYAAECNRNCLPAAQSTTRLDPNVLERQVELLLPMAWLEAAIFFVCMSGQSSSSSSVSVASRWNQLAVCRLENYHASLSSSP